MSRGEVSKSMTTFKLIELTAKMTSRRCSLFVARSRDLKMILIIKHDSTNISKNGSSVQLARSINSIILQRDMSPKPHVLLSAPVASYMVWLESEELIEFGDEEGGTKVKQMPTGM